MMKDGTDKFNSNVWLFSFVVAGALLLGSIISGNACADSVTQIGRYETVNNVPRPAQIDPLLAVGQYRFSPSIKTVGGAVRMVLENSGYTLAPERQLSPEVKLTLKKPLPITVRRLGPLSIKKALRVLMGMRVFTLNQHYLQRTVNFTLKRTRSRQSIGVTKHA